MIQLDTKKINDIKARQVILGLKHLTPKLEKKFGAKIYLVGGFVRDFLMGKPGGDIDITVEYPDCDSKKGVDEDVAMFMIDVAKFMCDNLSYLVLDVEKSKMSPVYKKCVFVLPDSVKAIKSKSDLPKNLEDLGDIEGISQQGTLNISSKEDNGNDLEDDEKMDLDVVLSRSDNYDGRTGKCMVRPVTFEKDCFRRDFTINALGVNLSSMEILDPTGRGIEDLLHNYVLRSPQDPYKIFLNDPIRVLRTIRFRNRFKKPDGSNFDIDDKIKELFDNKGKMKNILDRFGKGDKVSYGRISKEITKIMDNTSFGNSLKELKKLGIIDKLDKRLSKLIDEETASMLDKIGDHLDEVEKLTVWFKDYDKVVQEQIGKGRLKKPIDILTVMKKMKCKDEISDEVGRLLDALKLADVEFGEKVGDDKVKDIIKKLISRKHDIYVLQDKAEKVWKNCKRFLDLSTKLPQYKGYEEFYKRLERMGGLKGICEDILLSRVTEEDLNKLGVIEEEDITKTFRDIEFIVEVLKPFNKRFSLDIDEAFIKSRLFDDNEETRWDIRDCKVCDEHGRVVSERFKHLVDKLENVANQLEKNNMFKQASYVDNMVRMIKTGSIDIINATPHDISIYDDNEKDVLRTFKHHEKDLIRMEESHSKMDDLDGVKRIGLGLANADLPEKEKDVYYIVSNLIAVHNKDRDDLLTPALSVRDDDGNIIGCRALGSAMKEQDKKASTRDRIVKLAAQVKEAEMQKLAAQVYGIHLTSADKIPSILSKGLVSGKRKRDNDSEWSGWSGGAPFTQEGVFFFSSISDMKDSGLVKNILNRGEKVGVVIALTQTQDKASYMDHDYHDEFIDEDTDIDDAVKEIYDFENNDYGRRFTIHHKKRGKIKDLMATHMDIQRNIDDNLREFYVDLQKIGYLQNSYEGGHRHLYPYIWDAHYEDNKDMEKKRLKIIDQYDDLERIKDELYRMSPNYYKKRYQIKKDIGFKGANRIVGVMILDYKGNAQYPWLEQGEAGIKARNICEEIIQREQTDDFAKQRVLLENAQKMDDNFQLVGGGYDNALLSYTVCPYVTGDVPYKDTYIMAQFEMKNINQQVIDNFLAKGRAAREKKMNELRMKAMKEQEDGKMWNENIKAEAGV